MHWGLGPFLGCTIMGETEVFEALRYRIKDDCLGNRRYYNKAGQLHRTNGPAIEWDSGSKSWYQNGILHRTNGPAIEYTNGYMEWWLDGVELSKFEFEQAVGTHDD